MKLRIGILDTVPKTYWAADNNYTEAEKIVDFLNPACTNIEFDSFYVAEGQWPVSLKDYDGYIISGSPAGANDNTPWVHQLSDLIIDAYHAEKKLVGICFGHQLIAKTMGGEVRRRNSGWRLGLKHINICKQLPWMSPGKEQIRLYHINQDEVIGLPDAAEQYATSSAGGYDGYAIHHNIFCIQGHPEQRKQSMLNYIKDMRKTESDTTGFDQAVESMEKQTPHMSLFAGWIVQFLNY